MAEGFGRRALGQEQNCAKDIEVAEVNVRTLADSKLGVDLFRGSASLELYRGSSLQVDAQRLQKRFIYCLSKKKEYIAIYRAYKP